MSQRQITAQRWQKETLCLRRNVEDSFFPLQNTLHHTAGLCGILK